MKSKCLKFLPHHSTPTILRVLPPLHLLSSVQILLCGLEKKKNNNPILPVGVNADLVGVQV